MNLDEQIEALRDAGCKEETIQSVCICFEKGEMPYGCNSVIFDNGSLENLTAAAARWYTVILLAIPLSLCIVCLVVTIRRKNR